MKRLAGVVAVVVLCLASAAVADASYPGRNGRIVYTPAWWSEFWAPVYQSHGATYGPAPSGIFSMRADGTHRRRLSSLPGAVQPAWSPLGRRIAFAAVAGASGNSYELYAMDADGSHVRRLTTNSLADLSPTWGPGGHALAAIRVRYRARHAEDDSAELRVISLTGGPERVLARGPIRSASWAPGSRLIAYTTGQELFVVSAAGGNPRLVAQLPTGRLAGYLNWTRSGALVYSMIEDLSCPEVAVCALGVWAVDGIEYRIRYGWPLPPPQKITPYGVSAMAGVSSPDGRRFQFCTPRDWVERTWTLWTMRGDGAKAHDVRKAPCPGDWQTKP